MSHKPQLVISIHVPREGDDVIGRQVMHNEAFISIHVPREGDDPFLAFPGGPGGISIHVPREGDDGCIINE